MVNFSKLRLSTKYSMGIKYYYKIVINKKCYK